MKVTPITDIIIKLNGQDDCTITRVAELIMRSDLMILLSIWSVTRLWIQIPTPDLDFWKSSRRVLAVHSQMFDKVFLGEKRHMVLLTQDEDEDDTNATFSQMSKIPAKS